MLHPAIELRFVSHEVGYGAFAKQDIPKGTITWVHDRFDQVIAKKTYETFSSLEMSVLEKYAYLNSKEDYILCWDLGKFLNHSCHPNVVSPGFNFDIAIRDIPEGHEMVADYGSLNLEQSFECKCNTAQCRKIIQPTDFETFAHIWDQQIKEAFVFIPKVNQPLWDWVQEKRDIASALEPPYFIPSSIKHMIPRR